MSAPLPAIVVLTQEQDDQRIIALRAEGVAEGLRIAAERTDTRLLTTADVAQELGYSSTGPVLDLIRAGKLPAFKINDEWRVRPARLRQFEDELETSQSRPSPAAASCTTTAASKSVSTNRRSVPPTPCASSHPTAAAQGAV